MTPSPSVPVAADGYASAARFRCAKRTCARHVSSIAKRPSPSGRKNGARPAGSARRNDQATIVTGPVFAPPAELRLVSLHESGGYLFLRYGV